MTLPSSGQLSLGNIGTELTLSASNLSLHSMSVTAGKTTPDSVSEFWGYTKPSAGGTGYIAGGSTTTGNNQTTAVDKMTYSTGVWSANGSSLATGRLHPGCVSDGSTYGYIAGGYNVVPQATNSIEKITFSTSTFSANAGVLSDNRYGCQGLSDRTSYGYFCLGYNYQPSPNAYTLKVDRITLSTGSVSAGASGLETRRYQAPVNGTYYGYLCAGHSGTAYISMVFDFLYSTGTMSYGGNVYGAVIMGGGLSNGSTYGYLCGGYNGSGYYANTSRIQFSTSTVSTANNLTVTRGRTFYGVSDASTYGYIGGGMTNASTLVTTSDRMTFSTEVFNANTSSMTSTHQMPGGLSSTGF